MTKCCKCHKHRKLNHRLTCKKCATSPTKSPNPIPNFKRTTSPTSKHCEFCNYEFPKDWNKCTSKCCSCCVESKSKMCSKEIEIGRKGISMNISKSTTQIPLKFEFATTHFTNKSHPQTDIMEFFE